MVGLPYQERFDPRHANLLKQARPLIVEMYAEAFIQRPKQERPRCVQSLAAIKDQFTLFMIAEPDVTLCPSKPCKSLHASARRDVAA